MFNDVHIRFSSPVLPPKQTTPSSILEIDVEENRRATAACTFRTSVGRPHCPQNTSPQRLSIHENLHHPPHPSKPAERPKNLQLLRPGGFRFRVHPDHATGGSCSKKKHPAKDQTCPSWNVPSMNVPSIEWSHLYLG